MSLLKEEGLVVTASSVCRLLKKYKQTGTIARRPGSGRPTKITSEVLQIVEAQMLRDDETTAVQLQKILVDSGHPPLFADHPEFTRETWLDIQG